MDAVRKLILEKVSNLAETSRKIGKNHAYLQQFVQRGVPAKLPEDVRERLAAEIGVPGSKLKLQSREPDTRTKVNQDNGQNAASLAQSRGSVDTMTRREAVLPGEIPGADLLGDRDLPVFGTAQGGKGALIVTTEAVDWVIRPDPLLRVKDGYGMIVTGDSMSPEHKSGSTALVNPHLPPRPGDTCVFRCHADDGTVHAVIKELRRFTDDLWYVRQYSPRKEFTLKRSEWQICHVTVGNFKRR